MPKNHILGDAIITPILGGYHLVPAQEKIDPVRRVHRHYQPSF
ncbi:hypothetical protein [Candidatus Colwellia aromaticivorans]|nr:hypothetical protein [Candidatus Colwellia aromaticivorans]